MRIEGCDHWRETVRKVYDMCHLRDEMAMDVVDLIEERHAAFFGAERR